MQRAAVPGQFCGSGNLREVSTASRLEFVQTDLDGVHLDAPADVSAMPFLKRR
jgi:hypothetical protein